MGFFGKKHAKSDNCIIRPWETAPHKGIAHYHGTCDSNGFYVYDFSVINDLRLNTPVTLEAVAADVFLRDNKGERHKFTENDWGIVYSLDGRLVGVAKARKEKVMKLLKDGYTVRMDAIVSYDKYLKFKTLLLGYSDLEITE